MRISTIVLMILFSSVSFAQNAPINFETGGQGATWTWTVFENSTNPALEIINNPFATGINTSAKVAKFTALTAGQSYAGVESNKNADLGQFVFNETNRIVKIMVYKTVISDVGIKFANATGWSQGEKKVANTRINEWEELTFNFSDFINPPSPEAPLSQIIIFPDFFARTQDNIIYFDNITFNPAGAPPAQPATAAPTPTRASTDVISLFSNAYTNVTVDTWKTSWSAATLEDITIDGNATKKYSQLDFVGIETVANQLNITSMTHIHMDVWSPDFTLLSIKLVDFGANGIYDGGGDDREHQVNIATPAKSQWVSLNIPLSDFTGLTTKEHLAQYIIVGQPTGTTTIYVDNFYFYSDISLSVNDYTENQNRVKFYPNPVKSGDKVQLSSDVKQIEVFDLRGTFIKSLNTTSSITTEGLGKGTYFLRIHTNNGLIQTQKLVVK